MSEKSFLVEVTMIIFEEIVWFIKDKIHSSK